MNYTVSFEELSFAYRDAPRVFSGYRADVPRGSVFAILGPNGRGKTTLLKVILGLLKPDTGKVTITGQMAFVPQLFQVTFAFTVLDMVLMGRAKNIGLFSRPSKCDVDAALAALDHFHMADLAQRSFHSLSGGQRQLVILARALVAEAEILVMDEPTSALDLKNQALVLSWIKRLAHKDGLTVIFTTHHPHHALAVADNSLLMMDEDKFQCGKTSTILSEVNLRQLYGIPMKHLEFTFEGQRLTTLVPVFV